MWRNARANVVWRNARANVKRTRRRAALRTASPCGYMYSGALVPGLLHTNTRNPLGKKGKKGQADKPKKLTPKDVSKRLDALVKKLEEEIEGAHLFAPMPPTEECPICCVPLSRIAKKSTFQVLLRKINL